MAKKSQQPAHPHYGPITRTTMNMVRGAAEQVENTARLVTYKRNRKRPTTPA